MGGGRGGWKGGGEMRREGRCCTEIGRHRGPRLCAARECRRVHRTRGATPTCRGRGGTGAAGSTTAGRAGCRPLVPRMDGVPEMVGRAASPSVFNRGSDRHSAGGRAGPPANQKHGLKLGPIILLLPSRIWRTINTCTLNKNCSYHIFSSMGGCRALPPLAWRLTRGGCAPAGAAAAPTLLGSPISLGSGQRRRGGHPSDHDHGPMAR